MKMIINYNIKQFILKTGISLSLFTALVTFDAKAQLNPLSGMFYQNQYLGNPAFAGLDKGLTLNMGARQQWSSIPGSPKTHSVTADYGFSKKVGLGLNLYNEEAGLLKRTRVSASYAYHLPLNDDNRKISFGISLGVMDERVMNEDINGEKSDISVGKFNQRDMYMDGDFGAAYTSNKLTLQAAIPNMKSFLKKDDLNSAVDRATFFTSASYKLYYASALNGFGIEPKISFRGVHGYHNIMDMGTNLSFADNKANLLAIYHTSQSATFGMGVGINNIGYFTGLYTTETAALAGATSGNFELSLKLKFKTK